MIAEVVPKAEDLATKGDVALLESDIAELRACMGELKAYIDSPLLRFTMAFFVPMWIAMLGMLGVLIAKI
jgi:hypothetical protein